MRIHFLNCGADRPVGGAAFGFSKGPLERIVCAAQLIETDRGLVLVRNRRPEGPLAGRRPGEPRALRATPCEIMW